MGLAIICVVLIVLSGFGVWAYARMDSMQKRITDLEAQNGQLEAQVAGLEAEVENLTDIIEAMANITFTFMKTEELKIIGITWAPLNAYATLTVRNTGTTDLTVVTLNVSGEPAWTEPTSLTLSSGLQGTIRVYTIGTTFLSGITYEFVLITAIGNTYSYIATAP
jgi:Tfp pilus assembly protein PilX